MISSTTVQHVVKDEAADPILQKLIHTFNSSVTARLDDTNFVDDANTAASPYIQDYHPDTAHDSRHGLIPSDAEYGDRLGTDSVEADDHPDLDNFIHANLLLDVGGEKIQGRVIQRAKEADGTARRKVEHTRTRCSIHGCT